MPTDFLSLVRRDHGDLLAELARLLDPSATVPELRSALDGARLGLLSHAEAEDIVLGKYEGLPPLQVMLAQARSAHLAQEGALTALLASSAGSIGWRDRVQHLCELVSRHAQHEERVVIPALRDHIEVAEYSRLAGQFATERLRQLAMMQPSGPVFSPYVAMTQVRARAV